MKGTDTFSKLLQWARGSKGVVQEASAAASPASTCQVTAAPV